MLKWIESTGKSEEAAIEAALQKLGMDRDEVSVEVLERAKSGFLGIGSCPAKVKVTYEAPDEPETPAPVEEVPAAPVAEPVKEEKPAPVVEAEAPAAAPAQGEKAEQIDAFLTGLLSHMGAAAKPVIKMDENGTYQVELVGQDLGGLIGRRGETLDAIQQLTGYAVNHGQSKRVRIHVDAEGYRAKREESLIRLAHKVAGKVVKYRRNVTLEPMNAYERHVIHTALQETPDVTTYSIGTEPNRRTVVAYSRGEHRSQKNSLSTLLREFFCYTMSRTGLHGLPTATTLEGMSWTTTLPAPITDPLPMVTPGSTVTLPPIHTLSPTVMGLANSRPLLRVGASRGWPAV